MKYTCSNLIQQICIINNDLIYKIKNKNQD